MAKKIYYIKNSDDLDITLGYLSRKISGTILRELVEMNYSKITIEMKEDDVEIVYYFLSELM